MDKQEFIVRTARPEEFEAIGKLMIMVYSQLEGFPKISEQPEYYFMLANVGVFANTPGAEILVAASAIGKIAGAIVFFNDMKHYGSGGSATQEKNACGFRLLATDILTRKKGIGKMLINACIEKAKTGKAVQMIIHSTQAMEIARSMYEKMGFKRSEDLDFMQGSLPVMGYRLLL